jgi:ATP/maltotriose-dependent transcriptional regulator MalT
MERRVQTGATRRRGGRQSGHRPSDVARQDGASPTSGDQGVVPRPAGPVLSGTKLHAPHLHPESIRRPLLTSRLADPEAMLAVVVGPAGYGKTTLLADWAEGDPRAFGWLLLDQGDNDLTVLVSYMIAALERARSGATDDSVTTRAAERDPVAALVAAANASSKDIVLVLDEYHHITNSSVHDAVLAFAERSPANVMLAIASRTEVPLPIARLRASGVLVELRAPDLLFTVEESDQLLNGVLASGLGLADIAALHDRTEGWPAALYLAYLSYRNATDRRAFVRSFGASNRHVGDYLTEQVIATLDPDTLQFMLATSIVDQMSGPLADALTETTGGTQRLVALERANLFLLPLDDKREWYRYHPLLAELLSMELRRTAPDTIPALHLRASGWFEGAGDVDRAIRHAIAAGDRDRAATLISASYLERIEWGRMATVANWLQQIGDDAVIADGRLAIAKAWTMQFLGRRAEARQALDAARMAADQGQPPEGTASFESSAELMSAAFPGGDVGGMVRSARRAFELESERDSPWRATVYVLLGFALVRAGSFAEARPYLDTGERLAVENGAWMDVVGARSLLARIARYEGQLVAAERLARSAIEAAEAHGLSGSATGAFATLELGATLVRAGRHLEGHALLAESLGPLRALGEPLPVAEGLLPMAEALRQLGRRRDSRHVLEEADALITSMADPGYLRVARDALVPVGPARKPSVDRALSRREMEVLRLMATGRSKREVAQELVVSYNTIHSHYRSIYRKLEVGSKEAAIERARTMDLIDDVVASSFSLAGYHPGENGDG